MRTRRSIEPWKAADGMLAAAVFAAMLMLFYWAFMTWAVWLIVVGTSVMAVG